MNFGDLVERSWESNRLVSVLLELTYRCNLDCFFCYNDLGLRGTPLTFAQYDALLADLAAMQVLTVVLTGGEPLAHPDFFRIGARARELGFVVRVKSNGHALRGELARRLRDEVDPFVVEVSLHGATAATHDRQTRVAGSFDRLLENLHEMRELGLRVKVNSTLTRWNEHEVAEMYAITDALDLPLRFDLTVSPRDDGSREPLTIAPTREGVARLMAIDDARYAARPLTPAIDDEIVPAVSGKHCGAGSSGVAIDPYGNVYPCVQWRRPVANLHTESMLAIWSGNEGLDEVRRETTEVKRAIGGRRLSFCPGLAEMLTGSAVNVGAASDGLSVVGYPLSEKDGAAAPSSTTDNR